MSFCENCERSTTKNTLSGVVEFVCNSCGNKVLGDAHSVRMKTFSKSTGQMVAETNQQLLKNATSDRTNTIIAEKCENCGKLWKVQVKLGETDNVLKLCDCDT
jgi:ribosomal protein L37AE/L43A